MAKKPWASGVAVGVEEPADAVDQPAHRLHGGDRLTASGDHRLHLAEQRQHRLEPVGVHQVGPQLGVVGVDRQGGRVGAVVGSGHHEPEAGAPSALVAHRRVGARRALR